MAVAGVRMPGLQSLALGTAGFIAPPFIEGYLAPYLPTALTTNQFGRYAVKAGAVLGLGWAVGAMAGKPAAYKIMYGGGIYILASVANDFLPQLTAGTAAPRAAYYPRLAAQPLLGDYGRVRSMTATTPARLQPQNRY